MLRAQKREAGGGIPYDCAHHDRPSDAGLSTATGHRTLPRRSGGSSGTGLATNAQRFHRLSKSCSSRSAKRGECSASLTGVCCLSRLEAEKFSRVTLDFDGSVISTGKTAEGTAVGYNNKRKGERSYYPLLCTVAQTAQVLDVFHRSGNVHDSHKAIEFMKGCIEAVRTRLPAAILESRKDAAFFSEKMVDFLDSQGVQFSISVPFECFAELKLLIESRRAVETAGLPVGLLRK